MLYVDSDLYWAILWLLQCLKQNRSFASGGYVSVSLYWPCCPEISQPRDTQDKAMPLFALLRRLPLPFCRILLFSQRKQLQPRPFYCVVCCCWCHIWVGLCLFSISIRKKDKPKYAYGIRWALRQSCDALDT